MSWCFRIVPASRRRFRLRPKGMRGRRPHSLLALAERGVRIRTRALITTLAARLLLGDLFLHGIGGAKYDHVTDRLIADFFGLEPPGYMVVSGTLHLPVTHQPARGDDLLQLRHRIRELEFHPEQFVGQSSETGSTPPAARPIGSLKSAVGLPPKRRRRPREIGVVPFAVPTRRCSRSSSLCGVNGPPKPTNSLKNSAAKPFWPRGNTASCCTRSCS